MLVLARSLNEAILIGDKIRIVVTEVRWRNGEPQVRLGIKAPKELAVDREEIRRAKDRGKVTS